MERSRRDLCLAVDTWTATDDDDDDEGYFRAGLCLASDVIFLYWTVHLSKKAI